MAEFAGDVPEEGKGASATAAGGGGGEEDSYPLTVIYCGGKWVSRLRIPPQCPFAMPLEGPDTNLTTARAIHDANFQAIDFGKAHAHEGGGGLCQKYAGVHCTSLPYLRVQLRGTHFDQDGQRPPRPLFNPLGR